MSDQPSPSPAKAETHRLRSGTAARLAGLPVTTLRVWERRYGVVGAAKSEGGQRTYSQRDVAKLRLLRQLTRAGHAIGTIATLELEALQALLSGQPTPHRTAETELLTAVVVGRGISELLARVDGFAVAAFYEDLDRVPSAALALSNVDVLVVRVASLQPADVDRILALVASLGAQQVLVTYAFGTEASDASLRQVGIAVRREPITHGEVTQWLRSLRAAPRPARVDTEARVLPRRFTDEALSHLATVQSGVACECVRHMSEIVAQLASFETYSRDCVSEGPADAALHRLLACTAGEARTLFENALQGVVNDRRLELGDGQAR